MTITERIDAITGIPPEYRQPICPAPKSVKIELTARCNYSCAFCARSHNLRPQGDMEGALYQRLVKEFVEAGVKELGLFYLGESMLLPWLPVAVRKAKEAGIEYCFLTTNGSLAKPNRLEALFRAGLDSLKFSLNYYDRDQFADITKADPRLFDLSISNIINSRGVRDKIEQETGHRCGLYASYIDYDEAQAKLMEHWITILSPIVDEIYALPLYNQASLVSGAEHDRGWAPTAGNRGRSANLRDPIPCWAVFREGHVTFDGILAACCFAHQGFEMGDLTRMSFMEAWNSEKFQALRRAHLAGDVRGTECENCVAYS